MANLRLPIEIDAMEAQTGDNTFNLRGFSPEYETATTGTEHLTITAMENQRHQEFLPSFNDIDTTGDGAVDSAEFGAIFGVLFDLVDANRDGHVDEAEYVMTLDEIQDDGDCD